MKRLLLVSLVLLAAATASVAAEMSLDQALKQAGTYKFGESRAALTVISDGVRDSAKDPAQRKALAGKLAAMLADKAVSTDAKRFLCRKLSLIGSAAEVPTIATFLADKDLSDMSRYALERIPAPEAVAALRAALGGAKGRAKIGIINSLGERRDAASTDALVGLLGGEAGVTEAAGAALGKIGGAKALKALQAARALVDKKLQAQLTNSLLLCADQLVATGQKDLAVGVYEKLYAASEPKRVRIAALQGLVAARGAGAAPIVVAALKGEDLQLQAVASGHVRTMPGTEATKAFAGELASLPAPAQVLVLGALGERKDKAAAGAVNAAVKSGDKAVRAAALRALANLGDASSVAVLAKALAGGDADEVSAVQFALRRISGKGTDAAMVEALTGAEAKVAVEIIKALADRKAAAATPALLTAGAGSDAAIRAEAIKALGEVAGADALGEMVQLMLKVKGADQTSLAGSIALVARSVKDEDQRVAPILSALKSADTGAKAALLGVLGRIGGAKALAELKASVKDSDADVQDAAVRALGNWPDEGAAADLLAVAKTSDKLAMKVLALRGYVAVVKRVADANKQVKMLSDALAVAPRTEEKQMVLGAVSSVATGRSIAVLTECLADGALKQAAAEGIFRLAGDRKLRRAKELSAARKKIEEVFQGDKKMLARAAKLPK